MADSNPFLADVLEPLHHPEAKAQKVPTLPLEPLQAFIENPQGVFPVLEIPGWLASAIGAKGRHAVFSAESMDKNKREHPELTLEEYALLPRLNGASPDALVIQDRANACVVIQEHGRRYLASIKVTKSGETLFVTTFHRLDDLEELARKQRRGRIIRPPSN